MTTAYGIISDLEESNAFSVECMKLLPCRIRLCRG
jgi:hypothetical protein